MLRLVGHNGECYYPENCPCAWLGLEYLPGETVDTPCYRWLVYFYEIVSCYPFVFTVIFKTYLYIFFSVCVIVGSLTARTFPVQLCVLSIVTVITTHSTAWNMTLLVIVKFIS